jgi:hypothetical protein
MPRQITIKHLLPVLVAALSAQAQFPTPSPQSQTPEPPRDIPLVEENWEQLPNQDVGEDGRLALSVKPDKWKHAETGNFILHFRRFTEARKVAREVEYDLWFVAKALGATRDQYARKSHVFIFEDEAEWAAFLPKTNTSLWAGSFANGDNLFLNVRQQNGLLDSHTLAHETTHAVVARIYGFGHSERWPIWLNEGFAEYMGGTSVAARNHQLPNYQQHSLNQADFSLEELTAVKTSYPKNTDPMKIGEFYRSAEKLVRFLMTRSPADRFPKFIDVIIGGATLETAVVTVYGDQYKDFDTFRKKYEAFSR